MRVVEESEIVAQKEYSETKSDGPLFYLEKKYGENIMTNIVSKYFPNFGEEHWYSEGECHRPTVFVIVQEVCDW